MNSNVINRFISFFKKIELKNKPIIKGSISLFKNGLLNREANDIDFVYNHSSNTEELEKSWAELISNFDLIGYDENNSMLKIANVRFGSDILRLECMFGDFIDDKMVIETDGLRYVHPNHVLLSKISSLAYYDSPYYEKDISRLKNTVSDIATHYDFYNNLSDEVYEQYIIGKLDIDVIIHTFYYQETLDTYWNKGLDEIVKSLEHKTGLTINKELREILSRHIGHFKNKKISRRVDIISKFSKWYPSFVDYLCDFEIGKNIFIDNYSSAISIKNKKIIAELSDLCQVRPSTKFFSDANTLSSRNFDNILQVAIINYFRIKDLALSDVLFTAQEEKSLLGNRYFIENNQDKVRNYKTILNLETIPHDEWDKPSLLIRVSDFGGSQNLSAIENIVDILDTNSIPWKYQIANGKTDISEVTILNQNSVTISIPVSSIHSSKSTVIMRNVYYIYMLLWSLYE